MRINFLIEETDSSSEQNGILNAATRFAESLRKNGVDVDINGKGYDYDIIHTHVPSPKYIYKFKKARKKGIKIITHAHTTVEDVKGSFTLTENKNILKILKKYLIYFYNQGDLVLTPSIWSMKTLKRGGVKTRINVISNGVDIEKFKLNEKKGMKFRKEYGVKRDEIIVYSVGMVFLRKGIDTFRLVAKKLPNIKFFWIGKKYRSIKINPIKTYKVFNGLPENCKFLGFVEDIIGAHSGGDIFFFPSYVENQGIVILEAASIGKPIIVRDIPVYKNWLYHGENCLKGKKTADFVKNIERLLGNERLRQKLVKNSRELAEKNDLRKISKQMISIYENLLNS
ncbi:MAG: glycosyltransferase family 4 protein [Candidatus Aenigmarchaeota archaeon]|nr:glycosyltransferase family 4 protein [Candidatus Aenigmarchaeota archaeon]